MHPFIFMTAQISSRAHKWSSSENTECVFFTQIFMSFGHRSVTFGHSLVRVNIAVITKDEDNSGLV